MPPEPAIAGLQNELDVFCRGQHRIRIIFFEMMNLLDHAVGTDVGAGDGFGTILHPERRALWHRQKEKHGIRVLDVGAEHHAGHYLLTGQRQFCVQNFRTQINLHRRQFRLRLFGQHVVNGPRRDDRFGVDNRLLISFFATGQQYGCQ